MHLSGKSYSRGTEDLTELKLTLDRRVLDCLVGLDNERDEVSLRLVGISHSEVRARVPLHRSVAGLQVAQSTNLYTPTTEFHDVVLPERVNARLLEMLSSHSALRSYSKRVGLSKTIPQAVVGS